MPTYAYRCWHCGHVWELLRRITRRDDPVDCVRCGVNHTETQGGEAGGRLRAREFVPTSPDQLFVPAHFAVTLPTTGLKGGGGRSGEWENLAADHRRWDSGATGRRAYERRMAPR